MLLLVECADHGVGETLPTLASVRARHARADCESRVEQQDSLPGPSAQVPLGSSMPTSFLSSVQILRSEGGFRGVSPGTEKHRPCALARTVVGVLTQDDDTRVLEVGQRERREIWCAGGYTV